MHWSWNGVSSHRIRNEERPEQPSITPLATRARGRCHRPLLGLGLSLVAALTGPSAGAAVVSGSAATGSPLRWSAFLDSEVIDNLSGGIAPGSMGDHLARLNFRLDGAALGLPEDSQFKATQQRTQSGQPSATHIGDVQSVSNIETQSRSQVYEFWYGQHVGRSWNVRAGLIGADDYFDVTDSAGLLLNGSFGTQPTLSVNTVVPIFPTAGVGAMSAWRRKAWTNRVGIFQADPNDRASALQRGALLINEAALPGHGGLQAWRVELSTQGPGRRSFRPRPGAPTSAPTILWPVATARRARAELRGLGAETAYEVTYQIALAPQVSLQPDLQYVANPSGTYPSATVAGLRLHVEFE